MGALKKRGGARGPKRLTLVRRDLMGGENTAPTTPAAQY